VQVKSIKIIFSARSTILLTQLITNLINSLPVIVFAVNFKWITGIPEIFCSLSDPSPRLSQWHCWFTSSRMRHRVVGCVVLRSFKGQQCLQNIRKTPLIRAPRSATPESLDHPIATKPIHTVRLLKPTEKRLIYVQNLLCSIPVPKGYITQICIVWRRDMF
jgi:hypothetical protein